MIEKLFSKTWYPLVALLVVILAVAAMSKIFQTPAAYVQGHVMAVKEMKADPAPSALMTRAAFASPIGANSLSLEERKELLGLTGPQEIIVRMDDGRIVAVTSVTGGFAPGEAVTVKGQKISHSGR